MSIAQRVGRFLLGLLITAFFGVLLVALVDGRVRRGAQALGLGVAIITVDIGALAGFWFMASALWPRLQSGWGLRADRALRIFLARGTVWVWLSWAVVWITLAVAIRKPDLLDVALFPVLFLALAAVHVPTRAVAALVLGIRLASIQIWRLRIGFRPVRLSLSGKGGLVVTPRVHPVGVRYILWLLSYPAVLLAAAVPCLSLSRPLIVFMFGMVAACGACLELMPLPRAFPNTMGALLAWRRAPSSLAGRVFDEVLQGKRAREWSVSLDECVAAADAADPWMALFAVVRAMDEDRSDVAERMIERGLAMANIPHSVRVDLSIQAAMLQALVHADAAKASAIVADAVSPAEPEYDLLAVAAIQVARRNLTDARAARDSWLKSTSRDPASTAYRRGGNEWALDRLAAALGPPTYDAVGK